MVKYKGSRLGGKGATPVSFNLLFGPYIGILKSASILSNGDSYPASERFHEKDYGIITGLEYDVYIKKRLNFSTALRSSLGVREIYTPEWQDKNISTLNLAIGANIGLKYLLIKDRTTPK